MAVVCSSDEIFAAHHVETFVASVEIFELQLLNRFLHFVDEYKTQL